MKSRSSASEQSKTMLPSLRGTISGGGPPPPESVIIELMKANQADWDTAPSAQEEAVGVDAGGAAAEQAWVDPLAKSVPGKSTLGLSGISRATETLGKFKFGSGLGLADYGRLEDSRISFAKAIGSIEAWQKASSHFNVSIPVTEVIAAQPAWDVEAAKRILERLSIEPDRKLEELTDEQRDRLIRLFVVTEDPEA
jgi:hypothetical protein